MMPLRVVQFVDKASKIDQNRCRGSQRSRVLLSMDASESTGLKLRRRKKSRNIDDRFAKGLTGKGMQSVRPLFIYLVVLSYER